MRTKQTVALVLFGLAAASAMVGCNSVIGLNQFSIDSTRQPDLGADATTPDLDAGEGDSGDALEPRGDCVTNVECTQRMTVARAADGGDGGVIPAVCVKSGGAHCVELLSEDCTSFVGPYENDKAIILGTLFTTRGDQGTTNIPRQQSATMAAEQINLPAVGGIPGPNGPRPIVMVSCDETMAARAAGHLVDDLHVPAIVGPNTSQDTLELSQTLTNAKGTVLITPTAVASSIADLDDHDLTWLMVPSDLQRAPLMIKQLNEMEAAVKSDPARTATSAVRLAIVYRNDALGQGTNRSLNSLMWNGKPLTDPGNYNGVIGSIRIEPYKPTWTDPEWAEMVARVQGFAPEIVVVAGTAEGYAKFMAPLEAQLLAAKVARPQYMLIDSNRVPALLDGAGKDADFRKRLRGTGVVSVGASASVLSAFTIDYMTRWNKPVSTSGMGPSYDATYALAYALAATRDLEVTGANIAKGLRKLGNSATVIDVGSGRALKAFNTLASGATITAIGTYAPLEWDMSGAPLGGTLEMWCIAPGASATTAVYRSSGLTYDIKSQVYSGTYKACDM